MSNNGIPALGHRRVYRFTRDSERADAYVELVGYYHQTANGGALFDDRMDFLRVNARRRRAMYHITASPISRLRVLISYCKDPI
jgi:hypothetical protein